MCVLENAKKCTQNVLQKQQKMCYKHIKMCWKHKKMYKIIEKMSDETDPKTVILMFSYSQK